MLLVKTKLAPSLVHGIGLFADQDIKKGDLIWEFDHISVEVFSPEEFCDLCDEIPLIGIQELTNYSYIKDSQIYYVCDNARFINHGLEPNIAFINHRYEAATRDIKKGEELIENYLSSYDANDFFQYSDLLQVENKDLLVNYLRMICVDSKNISRKVFG